MSSKPRTILILASLFFAGAASGAFLAIRLATHDRDRSLDRLPFLERNLEHMNREFTFTPEQRSQIEAVMRATGDELSRLRRESRQATYAQIRAMNAKIEVLLTPEQRPQFAAFQKEQTERLRRRQIERDQRRRLAHPGEPPPPEEMAPEGPGEAPPPPPPPK